MTILFGSVRVIDEEAGADPAGVNDSTTAIQAALSGTAVGQRTYDNAVIPPGTYRVTDTIAIDVYRCGLIAPWHGVMLDFRELPMDGRPAFHFRSSGQPANSSEWGNEPPAPMTAFEGIRVQGPGGSDSVGLLFHADYEHGRVSNFRVASSVVRSFGTGVRFGDHAYCLTFDQLLVHRCGTGFRFPSGTTDSGERLSIANSTVYGSGVAVRQESGGRFHIVNSSFDYNNRIFIQSANGMIFASQCHFEGYAARDDQPDAWFENAAGSMIVRDSILTASYTNPDGNTSSTKQSFVVNNAAPSSGQKVIFDQVRMTGIRPTSNFFSSGGGITEVDSVRVGTGGTSDSLFLLSSEAANIVQNPSFEESTLQDVWFVSQDTAPITEESNGTSSLSGANISAYSTTAKSYRGTRSLRVVKKAAGAAAITVAAPIEAKRFHGARVQLGSYGDLSGDAIRVVFRYGTLARGAGNRGLYINKTSPIITRTLAPATIDPTWTKSASTSNVGTLAPAWATHFLMTFDLSDMNPGSLFLDQLLITPS